MNRKQRILTILALTAFLIIGACHYLEIKSYPDYSTWRVLWTDPKRSMLPDVKMPWFMLGVIYAGLMFLLKDVRTEK